MRLRQRRLVAWCASSWTVTSVPVRFTAADVTPEQAPSSCTRANTMAVARGSSAANRRRWSPATGLASFGVARVHDAPVHRLRVRVVHQRQNVRAPRTRPRRDPDPPGLPRPSSQSTSPSSACAASRGNSSATAAGAASAAATRRQRPWDSGAACATAAPAATAGAAARRPPRRAVLGGGDGRASAARRGRSGPVELDAVLRPRHLQQLAPVQLVRDAQVVKVAFTPARSSSSS